KLTLLMSNLSGVAKEAVDGYPITNDNYEIVKKVLSNRFGDRTLLRQSLTTQLIKVPTAQGNVKSIRQTMGQIERICRILESQGLDIENEQVLCTIEAKLPKWLLREVYGLKAMYPDRYNVKTLLSIINAKLRVSEASEFMSGTLDSPKKPKEAQKKAPKAHLFATTVSKQNDQFKPKCYLCHQKHWVTDCFAYPNVESRKAQAIKLGLCLKCLGKGHKRANCPKIKPCFYCKSKDHHGALCEGTGESPIKVSVVPDRMVSNTTKHPKKGKKQVLTTTVAQPAVEQVFNAEMPFLKQKTIVFFDTGSTFSGISNTLAQALKLNVVKTVDYRLVTYRSPDPESERFPLYEVGMTLADGSKLHLHLAGYDTLPKIDAAHVEHVPVNEEDTLRLEVGSHEPGILIGQQYMSQFNIRRLRTLPRGGELHSTILGPAFSGPLPVATERRGQTTYRDCYLATMAVVPEKKPKRCMPKITDQALRDELEKMWRWEAVGISDDPVSLDDDRALEKFEQSLSFDGTRYEVGWPYKETDPQVPTNFKLAKKRLKSQYETLVKKGQLELYDGVIRKQLKDEVTEVVEVDPYNEFEADNPPLVSYLPHQLVMKLNKPRIVYDASASLKEGRSLNDCMFRGPVYLPDLAGMLLRFREQPIIITSDIEKAFLQIQLRPEDRDVTRFLWLKDPSKGPAEENLMILRFKRLRFESTFDAKALT
ncbi:Pao retrotransposon peptidase family protein, partial [Aphelenchoides avenae]